MRYIGKHENKKVRERQQGAFVKLLLKQKNKNEINWFLESIVSPSELAYVSQRLEIMNLIVQGETYGEIRREVGTTDATIRFTKDQLEKCDDKFIKMLKDFNYQIKDFKKDIKNAESNSDIKSLAKAHYPGAIRIK